MNSLKNIFIIALLAAVAYGVYLSVNNKTPTTPPPGVSEGWGGPVQVEMPGSAVTSPSGGPGATNIPPSPGFPTTSAPLSAPVAAPFAGMSQNAPLGTAPPAATATPQLNSNVSAGAPGPANAIVGVDPTTPGATATGQVATTGAASGEIRKEFMDFLAIARAKLDAGSWEEVHRMLTSWYGDPRLTAGESAQLTDLLDQIAGSVIYSRQPLVEGAHVVQPGETVQQIADSYHVPWELLAKINGIRDPQDLRPGQGLKVVRGPFHAVVHLDSHELTLMLDDCYAGRFPIGFGKDHPPAEGTYIVKDKVKNPTYYGPNGITIEARDPRNPLGERWIGLGNQIGIHGTNDPQSVGRDQTAGSICLNKRDVEDVFDILSVDSRVVVRR